MKRFLLTALGTVLLAPTATAIVDTNHNGLSDLWETTYSDNHKLFGDTFDPQADADADGWTNAQEAAAGTDPFDPNPPDGLVRPETAHIPASPGKPDENGIPGPDTPEAVKVTWPTLVGKQYTLLFSPDLLAESWLPVGDPFIGNGNDFVYNFAIQETDNRYWRVAVTDVDTDGDGLTDAEEHEIGSSPYLKDTDGDGVDDAAAHAAGRNPAGDGTDADGDGVPDNELYSVVFEILQESHTMPYGVGFVDFYGIDNTTRYLIYQETKEYSVSDSPRYSDITNGSQVVTSSHLSNGIITADGQPVSQTEGTAFSDWKSTHQIFPLGQDEYLVEDPTETTVVWPTVSATETVTTTTETTGWKVKRHVPGDPQGQLVSSGTETIVVTERFKLTIPVTYPEFWTSHVKARPWSETPAATHGPLNWVDYNRACIGDAQAAETVRDYFRYGDFNVSGYIAEPGTAPTADYGYDERLKRVRWRWVRFNPNSPFGYEYAAPPAGYRLNFHFLVTQNEFLDYRAANGSSPLTDETATKAVIGIECRADLGTAGWEEIPLETFNAHRIEDPVNLLALDFSKWGGTRIWFGTQVDMDFIKPGTEKDDKPVELAAAKEDAEGEVVNINWDDDDNSEGDGGHGILVFKNDYDNTAANPQEDDMVQLKLRAINFNPGGSVAKARVKFDGTFVRIWRNQDRTGPILSEETEIELASDQTVYLEGRKLTEAECPKEIEMQIKLGSGSYVPGDSVKVHVATPIMLFSGVNPAMSNEEASSVIEILRSNETLLGKRRVDNRRNTAIIRGKDQSGQDMFYSVDVLSANSPGEADEEEWSARLVSTDKEMKIALALEGAHLVFAGHSNFGLGPNFMKDGTQTVDDFMNVSNFGIAGIALRERLGDLGYSNPMKQPDHGGALFEVRDSDIMGTVQNQWVEISGGFRERRFPVDAASITRKPEEEEFPDYHFVEGTAWATIVGSTGDIPTLRYGSLFMDSCNSGRHFGLSFNRKPFMYTLGESYSEIRYEGEVSELDSEFTSYIFIEGVILGREFGAIASFLDTYRQHKAKSLGGLYRVSQ